MTVTVEDVSPKADDRYHYLGTCGHSVSNSPRPLVACPVWSKGHACEGTLERYGPGSRRS